MVALVSVFAALKHVYTMDVVPHYAKQFTAEGNAVVRKACIGAPLHTWLRFWPKTNLIPSGIGCPLVVTWFLVKDNFDPEWFKKGVFSHRHTPGSSTVDSIPTPRPAAAAVEGTLERPSVDAVADPPAAAAVRSVLKRPAAISGADHKTDKGGSARGKCSHPGHYLPSSECGGNEWSRSFID